MYRRPAVVYDVDLGQHQTIVTADLRSSDKGCFFQADLTVQWRVLDPSEIIRHLVTDVVEVLSPDLLLRAQAITRNLPITEWSAAEDLINAELSAERVDATDPGRFKDDLEAARNSGRLGAEYGLWTRVIAHLQPDEAAAAHLRSIMKVEWEIKEETARHELRKLQEANSQEITLERVVVFREIIAAGDIDRFALQLANNPGDIAALHKIIREELQASRRDTIDFVTHMVDSGVIERWEVSDQVKETLRFIQVMSARVIRAADTEQATEVPNYQRRRQGRAPVIQAEVSESDTEEDGNDNQEQQGSRPPIIQAEVSESDTAEDSTAGDKPGSEVGSQ